MVLIAMIVSGLALLAASVSLYLLMQEKKRNQERNAAAVRHTEVCMESAQKYAHKLLDDFMANGEWEKAVAATAEAKIADAVNDICTKMSEAYFSTDINAGLGNILGFDPYASLKMQREKERGER